MYLKEWKTGYIEFWNDYVQFLSPGKYNWLNFTFFHFDVELDRMIGDNLTIELGFLGFNFRFMQFIRRTEKTDEMDARMDEIQTTLHADAEEKIALLNAIEAVKDKPRKLSTLIKTERARYKKDLELDLTSEE